MFDVRYHVASLAAVFIALILGIVIGVGLSGSGVTKESDLKAARLQRDRAQAERDANRAQLEAVKKRLTAFETAYPFIVHNRLPGMRVAVLYVGRVDDGVASDVEQTLSDSGARLPMRVVGLTVPVDVQAIDNVLAASGPELTQYVGDDTLAALGAALGREFVVGGDTPLWRTLGRQLVGERTGSIRAPADAVVVVRTEKPQRGPTARFLHGLYAALASSDVPAVGVEETGATPSAVKSFGARGLSTVDDIDLDTGRAALALLLAGADPGSYGVGDDADRILPRCPVCLTP
jgi:hypothetical protein